MVPLRSDVMLFGRSLCAVIATFGVGIPWLGVSACSSSEHPPFAEHQSGLGCGHDLRRCDIHEAACRQDVLDAVACLRDYDEQVQQPEARFIRLSDLTGSPSSPVEDATERYKRVGYSLLGLVSGDEIDDDAAQAAQVDSIAALYSPRDKTIYVLEDPGGQDLSEAELGVPLEVYQMAVLAHEYVHFLQDREFDLEEYGEELPLELDPSLAGIAAVEGEAMLYEGFFSFDLAGVSASDERMLRQFEEFIDYSEEQIRLAASPVLEARMLFPYTYGGHSNARIHQQEGQAGLAVLRAASSTLEFVQRRWGSVEPLEEPFEPVVSGLEQLGFDRLSSDQLGPWLLNAFWSRSLGAPTPEALGVAQLWYGDRVALWRNPESQEVVANWAIGVGPGGAPDPRLQQWVTALRSAPPEAAASWEVRVMGDHLEMTASTSRDSEAVKHLGRSGDATVTADGGAADSDVTDVVDAGAEPCAGCSTADGGTEDGGVVLRPTSSNRLQVRATPEPASRRSPEAVRLVQRLRARERLQQFVRERASRLW